MIQPNSLFLLLNDDCLRPAPTAPPDPEPPKIGATIGRSGLVDELLTAVQNRQSIILTGEPGIGKSTVHSAVYYHLKRKINPVGQTICYYRLIEEGTLKDRLAKIQSEIYDSIKPSSGGESKSPQDIVKYIKSYTAKYRLYFFIDNVDDDCSVRSLVEMYHDCPQIIYVVTSRCNVWDMAKMIEVIGLASEDGYELIKKAYETGRHIKFDDLLEKEYRSIETSISFDNFKINKRIELMQLSDKVMGHPMILEDFGAKLRLERFTTDKLVGEYQTVDVAKMLDDKYEKIEKMIFNKLPEIAHECFFIIGLLDTSDISCEIAQYIGNINEKILKVLDDYFLIRLSPSEHYFSVHQTFRTWCRHKYIKHGDVAKINHSIIKLGELYLNKAAQKQFPIEVIRKEWPNILKIIDSSVNAEISLKILDLAIGDNYDDPNGYIPQKSLMGIILQDSRIEKLQNDLSEITDHLLKAKIQKNIGHFYYWRGEYNIAEKFFLEAKSNYEMASSNNSDNFQSALEGIAATTSLLGYIADDENRFTEAENYYKTGKKFFTALRRDDRPSSIANYEAPEFCRLSVERFRGRRPFFKRGRGVGHKNTETSRRGTYRKILGQNISIAK
ncbi:MAG: tetratricopeptide repeat protein [Desulfobacteraceae bacterium]